jgi:hypothetical protein
MISDSHEISSKICGSHNFLKVVEDGEGGMMAEEGGDATHDRVAIGELDAAVCSVTEWG